MGFSGSVVDRNEVCVVGHGLDAFDGPFAAVAREQTTIKVGRNLERMNFVACPDVGQEKVGRISDRTKPFASRWCLSGGFGHVMKGKRNQKTEFSSLTEARP